MLSGWAICERVTARYSQLYTSLVLMRAVTQTLLHTISFHSRKAAHVHVTTRDFVTARLRAFELGVSLSGHRSGTAHSCVICTFVPSFSIVIPAPSVAALEPRAVTCV